MAAETQALDRDTVAAYRFRDEQILRRLSLDDLPRWSVWPARLLRSEDWFVSERSAGTIEREYNDEKYRTALASYQELQPSPTYEQFLQMRLQQQPSDEIAVSSGNDLVVTTPEKWCDEYAQLIAESMSGDLPASNDVIELGCGFGQNLWKLSQRYRGKRFIGGDYSERAVQLANHLAEDISELSFLNFNYYDDDYDQIFDGLSDGTATVFTSHSVEQTPSAQHFIETLSKYRHKIRAVYHFEPVYELHGDSLLGMMRQRYADVNNYNLDLMSVLESRSDITIAHQAADVMGLNPLNPTSVIRWHFR